MSSLSELLVSDTRGSPRSFKPTFSLAQAAGSRECPKQGVPLGAANKVGCVGDLWNLPVLSDFSANETKPRTPG